MQPPAQELSSRDLHDTQWPFRHIYRGKRLQLSQPLVTRHQQRVNYYFLKTKCRATEASLAYNGLEPLC